jgi:nucleoside-diphosphate-sugar epimerase
MTFSFFPAFLGGSGFLGQHIVRLIEERDPTVKEIRIVDLRPYENRLSKYPRSDRAWKGREKARKTKTRRIINFNPIFGAQLSRIFRCPELFAQTLYPSRLPIESGPPFSIC